MPILGLHINLAQLEDEATTNLVQAGLLKVFNFEWKEAVGLGSL